MRPIPARPAGDAGEADPAVRAALAAYAAGEATERATLTAVAASRLLVPIVALPAASGENGPDENGAEKETEMALPTLIGKDGRAAVIAFTGIDALRGWRQDARPVPVPAARLWAAALTEADAVVIDIAGPVPLVVEGARLRALAAGQPPLAAHTDPDIRAAVAAVVPAFTLEPGGTDADLVVALPLADPARARALIEQLAAALQPRLRRVQIRRLA